MEKIFDKDVQEYLLSSGVSENEINKILHDKYKQGMINIVKTLLEAIEKEDFNIIKDYTNFSPAGDCMGIDNTIIDFSSINGTDFSVDIQEAFNNLKDYEYKKNKHNF